ncbi:cysteine proteinase [Dacryopinax primogenitus]|uniref:Cysteine proteinase n=1 Tax=Dacryopinax primogenitus (strain DJM 731) TaxID=1858805 RepID=M5FYJ8_DACPD|nr:cysteine proteinase [Dacryopinax primogenitus]EJU01594.1 cysteine proteinase [Dacryopinax primogenitus]
MLPPEKEQAPTSAELVAQSLPPKKDKVGLLVTKELDKAIARCREKVERISRDCRKRNRRFRDLSFDVEEDRERCLHGLATPQTQRFNPSDVLRAGQIFDKPEFFIDGVTSGDIVQGDLGNCWFLSALATFTCYPELVEKVCVKRDEVVGVYGFIFYRDGGWVDVIIDDLLYVNVPKYESLTQKERNLYHNDKGLYNKTARKGGKTLYFARSGTENETWVPLIEKAYAKLHGDYAALLGGAAAEALEDLTGGVSTLIHMNDILDIDEFWQNELLKANDDRLFGCYLSGLEAPVDSDDGIPTVNGLIVGHAYSVLRAIEHNGRRFVRVRNPWGSSEWTGAWSDGSKEWNGEWLAALPALKHTFGDDGEFLMSYEDFLSTFWVVHRTKVLDPTWKLSSHWLEVAGRKFPATWNYGDVSFTFTMPKSGPTIVVLTQLDTRYFRELAPWTRWSFDFALFKRGEKDVVAVSHHAAIWTRSVNIELDLEEGEYVVHVRFDRRMEKNKDYVSENISGWNPRKLTRVLTECATAQMIAVNFDPNDWGHHQLPIPLDRYAGYDLSELEALTMENAINNNEPEPEPDTEPGAEDEGEDGEQEESGPIDIPNGFRMPESDKADRGDDPVPEDVPGVPDGDAEGGDGTEDEDVVDDVNGDIVVPEVINPPQNGPSDSVEDLHKTDQEPEANGEAPNNAENDQPGLEEPFTKPLEDKGLAAESLIIYKEVNGSTGGGFELGESPPAPPRIMIEPRVMPVHEGTRCDGCGEVPIVGIAYKCLEVTCPDFDLCAKCYKTGFTNEVHKAGHKLMPLRPGDRLKLQDAGNSEDEDSIIVGLKVFTKDCGPTPVTVKGQLRHGKIISWKRPEDD